MKDPYRTLGVASDADDDTIRTEYRKLARRYHPDVNSEAGAEERFKEISEAYSVLSDPDKRSAYDEFGEAALQGGFDVEAARAARRSFGGGRSFHGTGDFGFGNLEDLMGDLFNRGRGQRRGSDIEASLTLDFVDAALGGEQRITIDRPTADGGSRQETVTVRIPAGVNDGGRIRLRGKGAEGSGGGPSGDLFARIQVRPHRTFRREGLDLFVDVPVSIREAVLGAKVQVPTLDGKVTLTLPAGSDSGTRLRLRGKGVPRPGDDPAGDLFAVVQIRVPSKVDSETAAALEELDALDPPDLRKDWP